MAEDTRFELLITVVVSAVGEHEARSACGGLLTALGGRIVECRDCSDEEPGCWSVTVSRGSTDTGYPCGAAALSRAVRNFLRELGPEYVRHRVACEPPTAWTVVDNPDLLSALVEGGERLLVEAWAGGFAMASDFANEPASTTGEVGVPDEQRLSDLDENGKPRPRLELLVDVVTERRAGAEWPARALASRLSGTATILDFTERPPMVRVAMDLGPAVGAPREIVRNAMSLLGGSGWSRLQSKPDGATARWVAAPTPPSGIAAIKLTATVPAPASSAP